MFVWLAVSGLVVSAAAVATRSSRPLIWPALLLCAEELIALQIGARPAVWWAFVFAMLLFAGLEAAHWANARPSGPQPVAIFVRSLLPVFSAAAGVAILLALISGASALSGLGLMLTGLGGAAAIIAGLAVLAWRANGPLK